MKNIITKIFIILIIAIACILGFFIYGNAKEETQEIDKLETEIEYLDVEITNLINQINGINLENYKITVDEIEESEGSKSSGSSEKESSKKEDEQGDESKQELTITKMEEEQILAGEEEINWNYIQAETEVLYSVWTSIVLDLYSQGTNSETIVGFSNEIDQAVLAIKEKDKAKSAKSFGALYSFLPKFAENSKMEDIRKKVIESKSYILKAYAFVQEENWEKVQIEVYNAEKKFAEIMKDLNKKEEKRKYNINKVYILIQELKNSLATKDQEIFYIKYKNLLEGFHVLR